MERSLATTLLLQLLVYQLLIFPLFSQYAAKDGLNTIAAFAPPSCFDVYTFFKYNDALADQTTNGGATARAFLLRDPRYQNSYWAECLYDKGFTLIMTARWNSNLFRYGSSYWVSESTYNVNFYTSATETEAKLQSFNYVPYNYLRLRFKVDATSISGGNVTTNEIEIATNATSLYNMIKDNTYKPFNVALTRDQWRNATGPHSLLQSYCGNQGYNVFGTSNGKGARIGIIGNEQTDCTSPDSFIGVGIDSGPATALAGTTSYHGNSVRDKNPPYDNDAAFHPNLPTTAWVFASVALDCSGVNWCSGRGLCVGPNTCACESGSGSADCSKYICFGQLSISATVCSSRGTCAGPDLCYCDSGHTGSQCEGPLQPVGNGTASSPAKNCKEIWNYYKGTGLIPTNGFYTLYSSNNPSETYQTYCDMLSNGFTLIMKGHFPYDSPFWTNTIDNAPTTGDNFMDRTNVKYRSFYSVNAYLLSITFATTGADGVERIARIVRPLNAQYKGLYSIFRSDTTLKFGDTGRRTAWLSMTNVTSFPPNCNAEYMNFKSRGTRLRFRIGYIGAATNCDSPRNFIGVGATSEWDIPSNVISGTVVADTGYPQAQTESYPWIMVGDPYDCTSVNYCRGRGRCVGQNMCLCNPGWTGTSCQFPICKSKPSTDSTVCSGSGTCVGPDTCVCNSGFLGPDCATMVYKNTHYTYEPVSPVSNSDAYLTCAGSYSSMASIHSADENTAIRNFINKVTPTSNVWIGSTRPYSTTVFTNRDGTTFDYSNWDTGNPDIATSIAACVVQTPSGKWQDEQCDTPKFYTVCKKVFCNGIAHTNANVCNKRGKCREYNLCEQCGTQYTGNDCQVPICQSIAGDNPTVCSGAGSCIAPNTCQCNSTHTGTNCEITSCNGVFANNASVCSGHGSCTGLNKCSCNSNYTGSDCEVPKCNGIAATDATVCGGNGICTAVDACSCNSTHIGRFCDIPNCYGIYANNVSVCNRQGSCTSLDKCVCNRNYTGLNCDIPVCFNVAASHPQVCNGQGSCIAPDVCSCSSTYTGPNCTVHSCFGVFYNNATVCSSNGNCTALNTCQCDPRYSGPNCNIPVCFGLPANDSAVCTFGTCLAPDTCTCNANYTGKACTIPRCFGVDQNDTSVCNNGVCQAVDTCICNSNFTGAECTIPRCFSYFGNDSKVCSGRGFCAAVDKCVCKPGYQGKLCEVLVVDGRAFTTSVVSLPWKEASDYCQAAGGELATLQSAEDNNALIQHVSEVYPSINAFWVGYIDKESTGRFVWAAHGAPNSYEHWAPTEPSVEDCTLALSGSSPASGFWKTTSCATAMPFVCEKYNCHGLNHTNPTVCSSNGFCAGQDKCVCDVGWLGDRCDRDVSSKFCPVGQFSDIQFGTSMKKISKSIPLTMEDQKLQILYSQNVYFLVLPQDAYIAMVSQVDDTFLHAVKLGFACNRSAIVKADIVPGAYVGVAISCDGDCCGSNNISATYCQSNCSTLQPPVQVAQATGQTLMLFNVSTLEFIAAAEFGSSGPLTSVAFGHENALITASAVSNKVGQGVLCSQHGSDISNITYTRSWCLYSKSFQNVAADSSKIITAGFFGRDLMIPSIELRGAQNQLISSRLLDSNFIGAGKMIVFIHNNGTTFGINIGAGTLPQNRAAEYGVTSIQVDKLGNVFIAGYTSFSFHFGQFSVIAAHCCSSYVMKINSNGQIEWLKTFQATAPKSHAKTMDLALDIYGSAYFSFFAASSFFVDDVLLEIPASYKKAVVVAKLRSTDGQVVFNNVIGVESDSLASALRVHNDGKIQLLFRYSAAKNVTYGGKTFTTDQDALYSLTYQHECIRCPIGQQLIDASTVSSLACRPCPAGTWNDAQSFSCKSCERGTYNPNTGSTSSAACIPCPVGTFTAVVGASSISQCTQCQAGTYSNAIGFGCTACPSGGFSKPGAEHCTQCGMSSYNSLNGTRQQVDLSGLSIVDFAVQAGNSSLLYQNDTSGSLELYSLQERSVQLVRTFPSGYHGSFMTYTESGLLIGGSIHSESAAQMFNANSGTTYGLGVGLISTNNSLVSAFACTTETALDSDVHAALLPSGDFVVVLQHPIKTTCSSSIFQSATPGRPIYTIVGLNSTGVAWTYKYANDAADVLVTAIKTNPAGDIFVAGQFQGTANLFSKAVTAVKSDIFIAKLRAANGAVSVEFVVNNDLNAFSILNAMEVDNGFIYAAGSFEGTAVFNGVSGSANLVGTGQRSSFVVKLRTSGQLVFGISVQGTSTSSINQIEPDTFQNLFVAGHFTGSITVGETLLTSNGLTDLFQLKIDQSGSIVWAVSGGTPYLDDTYWIGVNGVDLWVLAMFHDKNVIYNSAKPSSAIQRGENLIIFQSSCTLCPIGTYSGEIGAAKPSTCLSCPSGTFSNSTGLTKVDQCIQCPKGTWQSLQGSSSCVQCPAGTFSTALGATTIATCQKCPVGAFSNQTGLTSAAECYKCPNGTYGTIEGAINEATCRPCRIGYYQDTEGSSSCKPCPAGSFNDKLGMSTLEACTLCPSGTYSSAEGLQDEAQCVPCGAGTFNPIRGASSKAQCLSCPLGTFSNLERQSSNNSCKPCLPGSFGNADLQGCTECPAGTYQPLSTQGSSTSCLKCPAGTWSSQSGRSKLEDCVPCPLGYFSTQPGAIDSSTCQPCIAGTFSNNSGISSSAQCEICPPGTWSSAGSSQCSECPAGSYNPTNGSISPSSCLSCPAGTYSSKPGLASVSQCTLCPGGTYSVTPRADTQAKCTPCPAGQYSDALGASDSSTCKRCPSGTYSNATGVASNSSCIQCSPGYYSEGGAIACTGCPSGSYLPTFAAVSAQQCIKCRRGYFSSRIGADDESTCQPCGKGTYSDQEGATDESSCSKCPVGHYSSAIGADSLSYCMPCPLGYYSNVTGATSSETCASCLPGTYGSRIGATSLQECTKCPKGTFSNIYAANSSSSCVSCPIGTYNDKEGSVSESDCLPCPVGTYGPIAGATSLSKCEKCPLGTFLNRTGSTSKMDCILCPPGTFNEVEYGAIFVDACRPCDPGYYSTTEGATTSSVCIACSAGYYSTTPGASFSGACLPCPSGTFSDKTGLSRLEDCQVCPRGTYSNQTGSAQFKDCVKCPAGAWGNKEAANSLSDCVPCNAGFYSTTHGATSNTTCKACPQGYFSTVVGASSADVCQPCNAGTYNPVAGSSSEDSCIKCPAGSYSTSVAATSNATCITCPAGSFGIVEGASNVSVCTACPKGYYSAIIGASSQLSCVACKAGTYSEAFGATSAETCIPCDSGYYSEKDGSTSCKPCKKGSFAASPGSDKCLPCDAGEFSDTDSSFKCRQCPVGTFNNATGLSQCYNCSAGTYQEAPGGTSCKPCEEGTFNQETAATSCSKCPTGSFNNQTALTSCYMCDAGYHSPRAGSTSCLICAPGNYSTANSSACTPCPPGSFSKDYASQTCEQCPAGYYAPVPGSTTCYQCIAGTYSAEPGAANCMPCAAGTYQPKKAATSCDVCGPDSFCSIGTVAPLQAAKGKTEQIQRDPYFDQLKVTNTTTTETDANSTVRIVIISLAVSAGIMVVLFMLIIFLIFTYAKKIENKGKLCLEKFISAITSIDRYSLNHFVAPLGFVQKKSTFLGGVMTLIYIVLALTLIALSILDVVYNNKFDKTYIAPEQVLPAKVDKNIIGNYGLTVHVYNFMDNDCNPSTLNDYAGFAPAQNVNHTVEMIGSTCVIKYTCKRCYLSGTSQYINLRWYQQFASASSIEYELSLPHFYMQPGSSSKKAGVGNTQFVVGEVIVPDSPSDELFRGPEATEIGLSLTKSYYTELAADYFFYSLFTRDGVENRTTAGYIATRFPVNRGSTVTSSAFHNIGTTSGSPTLFIKFDLSLNPSVFRLEQESKSLLLDLLSKMIALVGAIGTVTTLALNAVEKLLEFTKKVGKSAKKNSKEDDILSTPGSTITNTQL